MTFTEYSQMGPVDQEFLLWSKGVEIAIRRNQLYSYLLYQLDAFYIEVRYCLRLDAIDKITGFEDMRKLDPYLAQVNISTLY